MCFEPYSTLSLEETKENLEWRISSDEIFAIELKSTGMMIGNVFLGKRECENLERLGFVREGHLRKDIYFRKDANGNPIWKDTYIYSKLNDKQEKL